MTNYHLNQVESGVANYLLACKIFLEVLFLIAGHNIDDWVEEEEMGGGSEVVMRKGAVKRGMFFKKPSAKKSTPRYK